MANERPSECNSISELTPEKKRLTLKFRVQHLGEIREVKASFSGQLHRVSESLVIDQTGQVLLTLWNDDIDIIENGKSYILKNGHVTIYNHSMRLSKGQFGEIELIDEIIESNDNLKDMSRPFAWKAPRKKPRKQSQGKTFTGKRGRESKGYCSWKTF